MAGNSELRFFNGVVSDVPKHELERQLPRTDGSLGSRPAHANCQVGFYLTAGDPTGYVLASFLIDSVRKHMPGAPVFQFTDDDSPAVIGVDMVQRRKAERNLSLSRSAHYAACQGNWLFVDTDVVIQKDVRFVFNEKFDVMVTDRDWPHLPPLPESFMKYNPYCAGVVFSNNSDFWKEVHDECDPHGSSAVGWFNDQRALATIARNGKYNVPVVSGHDFQYPPLNDEVPDVAIMHYKGPERKQALLRRIHREWGLTIPV